MIKSWKMIVSILLSYFLCPKLLHILWNRDP